MHIYELTLLTNQLEKQVEFYSIVLGLDCIDRSAERASFQIGTSLLTFQFCDTITPYHFAFTIPSNKENEALHWLKQRVDVLTDGHIELHDFDFWNAKAMYFYDPDKNIVEFISRKNLNNKSYSEFNQQQLLNISEIGMPTKDIESHYSALHALSGIPKFSGGFERFLAFGDEHGLFICINKKIKDWFPTGDTAHSSYFELTFTEQEKRYRICFEDDSFTELHAF